jgi:hypothetical protein
MGQNPKRTRAPKQKDKGGKKLVKRTNVSGKVLKQLKLSSRVSALEAQMKQFLESKAKEAQFQAGLMFGINALAEVLESKQIVTMKELDVARIKVVREYRQEKMEEDRRAQVAKQYKNDPVHYDSTTDKWFVFAPNWKDKVGPFLDEPAAREALRIIKSPVPEPSPKPDESQEEVSDKDTPEPTSAESTPAPGPEPTSAQP